MLADIEALKRQLDGMKTWADYSSDDWTPTFTGFSADPASPSCQYVLIGKICTVFVVLSNPGTSNQTYFTMTGPFTANASGAQRGSICYYAIDNGAVLATPAMALINASSNIIVLYKDAAGAAWTAANGKAARFTLTYEIA